MKGNVESAKSRLKISEDVILTVAKLAALDVKGVAGLNGELNMLSKLRGNRPIKIELMGDVAAIDLKIIIKSGEKACAVAQTVQDSVKENVQTMTGIAVAQVNVTIDGIVFE